MFATLCLDGMAKESWMSFFEALFLSRCSHVPSTPWLLNPGNNKNVIIVTSLYFKFSSQLVNTFDLRVGFNDHVFFVKFLSLVLFVDDICLIDLIPSVVIESQCVASSSRSVSFWKCRYLYFLFSIFSWSNPIILFKFIALKL